MKSGTLKKFWDWFKAEWKVVFLSIVLAIISWIILINVANPMTEKSYQNVEVHVKNENVLLAKDKTYKVKENKTVTVVIRARKSDFSDISIDDIYVYTDMNYPQLGENGVDYASPIEFDIKGHQNLINAELVTIKGNRMFKYSVEEIIDRNFEVEVVKTNETSEEFSVGECRANPAFVNIKAPKSSLAKISRVKTELDQSRLNEDSTVANSKLHFYDANGNEVEDVSEMKITNSDTKASVNDKDVTINVTILKTKQLNVNIGQRIGEVAEDYRVVDVGYEVKTIKVTGSKAALAQIDHVEISGDVLNVEGATGDITREVDLKDYLPEDVTIADDQTGVFPLTIKIEKLETKEFKIPWRNVKVNSASENLEYDYPENVTITLKGFREDLENISISDLSASVSMGGYDIGRYLVAVDVDIPKEFELIGEPEANIRISKKATILPMEEGE